MFALMAAPTFGGYFYKLQFSDVIHASFEGSSPVISITCLIFFIGFFDPGKHGGAWHSSMTNFRNRSSFELVCIDQHRNVRTAMAH